MKKNMVEVIVVEVMSGFEWAEVREIAEVLQMGVRYIGTDHDTDADIYEEQTTGKFLAVVNRLNGGKMTYNNINGIELDQFNEILNELGYYDNRVCYMDDFNTIYPDDNVFDAILDAFYGGRFNYSNDRFNPNDKFFTYDGYDNLVSIPTHYLREYMNQFENEIIKYANDNEIYLDGVDEC